MVLVDTSVWVEHFRRGNERLEVLLNDGGVACHPYVVGELACGHLQNRDEILALLGALPVVQVAEHEEALHLVSEFQLQGSGLGWVDIHLLSSALLSRCSLFTLDKKLKTAAEALKIKS
jgi:predicted nucleic acid-binding protein